MTPTHDPTLPHSLKLHAYRRWMTSSAIAGTIGTLIGLCIAFLLSVVLRITIDPTGLTQEQILTALFQNALIENVLYGLCLGLTLGISFALAWFAWIENTARYPEYWMSTTIVSAIVGITLAYLGISLGEWYYQSSMFVTAAGGAFVGLIMGTAQSYVLWSRGGTRLRWLATQSLAFAGIFVLMAYTDRAISNFFLFPFIWLSVWGLYGLWMGYTFQEIAYNK
jgi:hypothetical protein